MFISLFIKHFIKIPLLELCWSYTGFRLLTVWGWIFCRYYGGWAAPNIYFLGFSGVVKFGNLRIGGLSGIYNARNYHLGLF